MDNINNQSQFDLSNQVMTGIDKGKIKMRPRWYFLIGSIVFGGGLILLLITSVILVDYVAFRLRTHGPFGYLLFGPYGLKPFLVTFPFVPLVLSIIAIGMGIYLFRRYDLSYKTNFTAISIAILIATVGGGFVLDFVGVNERLQNWEPTEQVLKERFHSDTWVAGEIRIIDFKTRTITLSTPNSEEIIVLWNEQTMLPMGIQFSPGMRIRVVGEWDDNQTFMSKGIGIGGLRWRIHPTPFEQISPPQLNFRLR